MYYTIYRITNNINHKVYVGKHQTNDLADGYMGSGKLIRAAIAKYGIDQFSKEILHVFDNEQDMNAKEAELVTEDFCREANYNLCVGGQGGFSHINSRVLDTEKRKLGRANADLAIERKYGPDWRTILGRLPKKEPSEQGKLNQLKAREVIRQLNKAKLGSLNPSSKRVVDDNGVVFDTIRDYAKHYKITPDGATRRLRKGQNIKLASMA